MRKTEKQKTIDAEIGYSLAIPYFKIFGEDGETIIRYMTKKDSKSVYIKVDLSLANPDNRVEYELWYSSILDITP